MSKQKFILNKGLAHNRAASIEKNRPTAIIYATLGGKCLVTRKNATEKVAFCVTLRIVPRSPPSLETSFELRGERGAVKPGKFRAGDFALRSVREPYVGRTGDFAWRPALRAQHSDRRHREFPLCERQCRSYV